VNVLPVPPLQHPKSTPIPTHLQFYSKCDVELRTYTHPTRRPQRRLSYALGTAPPPFPQSQRRHPQTPSTPSPRPLPTLSTSPNIPNPGRRHPHWPSRLPLPRSALPLPTLSTLSPPSLHALPTLSTSPNISNVLDAGIHIGPLDCLSLVLLCLSPPSRRPLPTLSTSPNIPNVLPCLSPPSRPFPTSPTFWTPASTPALSTPSPSFCPALAVDPSVAPLLLRLHTLDAGHHTQSHPTSTSPR
jgi:hypothetical protein